MKNTIYLIIGGEYSDWYIKGFRYNKEEAQQYCAEHNRRLKYNEFFVEEVNMIQNIPKLKLPMYIEYDITFDYGKGMRPINMIHETIYTGEKRKSFFRCNPNLQIWWFNVRVTADSKDKAIKIAIDYYNKFLYLVENYDINHALKEMNVHII